MSTLLYIVWIGLPAIFFFLWLWAKLEDRAKKTNRSDAGDLFRQFCFVTPCVIATILIDQTILPDIKAAILPDSVPLFVVQVLLLPAILYIGAMVIGPSKQIRIAQAPRPTERKKKK
jgi:putative copper export protein